MDSNKSNPTDLQKDSNPAGTSAGERMKDMAKDVKATFQDHKAAPGPAIPQDFTAHEEGTKEERRAKAEQLNKQ